MTKDKGPLIPVEKGTQPKPLSEGFQPKEQAGIQPTGKGPSGPPPNKGGGGGKK